MVLDQGQDPVECLLCPLLRSIFPRWDPGTGLLPAGRGQGPQGPSPVPGEQSQETQQQVVQVRKWNIIKEINDTNKS